MMISERLGLLFILGGFVLLILGALTFESLSDLLRSISPFLML